jgi:integrase
VSIDVGDLRFEEGQGVVIRIRRSKTDQESAGDDVSIAKGKELKTCPVVALRDWLETSGITSGPVFPRVRRGGAVGSEALTGYAVAQITAVRAAEAGLKGDFAGHSLRSGFATAAARG